MVAIFSGTGYSEKECVRYTSRHVYIFLVYAGRALKDVSDNCGASDIRVPDASFGRVTVIVSLHVFECVWVCACE